MLDMSGREVLNSEEEECEKLMCGGAGFGCVDFRFGRDMICVYAHQPWGGNIFCCVFGRFASLEGQQRM